MLKALASRERCEGAGARLEELIQMGGLPPDHPQNTHRKVCEMTHAVRRLSVGILAVGTLTTTLFTTSSMMNPGTANARCTSNGHGTRSNYYPNGIELVAELPARGTCDGNSTYTADLVDKRADNGAVAVWVQDIPNAGYHRVLRHSAAVNVRVQFRFTDRNHNRHANMKLCANANGGAVDYGCGWGSRRGAHGDNSGF